MNMFKKNGGFTLVELIVVIAILAILAGIAVPAYSGYMKNAQKAADTTTLSAVKTAAVASMATTGTVDEIYITAKDGVVETIKVGPFTVEEPGTNDAGEEVINTVKRYIYVYGTAGADAHTNATVTTNVTNAFTDYYGGTPAALKYFTTGAQWVNGEWTEYEEVVDPSTEPSSEPTNG